MTNIRTCNVCGEPLTPKDLYRLCNKHQRLDDLEYRTGQAVTNAHNGDYGMAAVELQRAMDVVQKLRDDPDTSGGAFWRGRETETDGGE